MIGNEIPVDEKTKIGMLCHDKDGQLVIVEPTLEESENLVIQALKCADFVDKFKMMLAATKPPRVILLLNQPNRRRKKKSLCRSQNQKFRSRNQRLNLCQ